MLEKQNKVTPEKLLKSVTDRLKAAGLEAELRALQMVRSRKQWHALGNPHYMDQDEGKFREYDVAASFEVTLGVSGSEDTINAEAVLAMEVKRSENNPWVLLQRNSTNYSSDEREALTAFRVVDIGGKGFLGVKKAPGRTYVTIVEQSLRAMPKLHREAYGLRELKEGADSAGGNRGFSALLSACKAAEHESDTRERQFRQGVCWNFSYVIPVVVLDAQLFSASISEQGQLEVTPTPWATVRFFFRSAEYTREVYLVDVVTLEQLPLYLEHIESGVPKVAEALAAARQQGLKPDEASTMVDVPDRRRKKFSLRSK